jgi:cytochrome c5
MGNQIIKALLVVTVVTITSMTGGCYYDNEEYLYGACDTTAVTYSVNIAPIMSGSCNSCHTGAGASGGVITSTYTDLKVVAASGQLWGAVNHASGFSPMPPTGIKLGTCELNRIKAWINQGMPE